MRRTKEDTEVSKLRILMAAEKEFRQRGFSAANMDSIAKAAGLTKGAIFWHYQSKVGLFRAIIRRATSRVKDIFREAFAAGEPAPVLEKCREVLKRVKKDDAFNVLLVLSEVDKTEDFPREVLAECNEYVAEILTEAGARLSEAKMRGELSADADVQNILTTIILIMSGFAKMKEFRSLIDPIGRNTDDDSIINTMFSGLLSYQK